MISGQAVAVARTARVHDIGVASGSVRRMLAVVGAAAPFDHGREQMQVLAGLEVTTKAVERTAEAIGEDIAAKRAGGDPGEPSNWIRPCLVGEPIPILYVQMDGTGVPVVKKETVGRQGKTEGQPAHTREANLGCVFTQTTWDQEGFPIRDPDSTTYSAPSSRPKSLANDSIWKPASAAGAAPKRKSSSAMEPNGSGILPINTSPARFQIVDLYHARQHLWDLAASYFLTSRLKQKAG